MLRLDPVDPVLSQLARTGVVEVRRITFKHRQSYKQQRITLVTMVTSTPQERELDFGPIQELFTFSPFGLGCQECKINVPIRRDERCIRDHLKKHGMVRYASLVVTKIMYNHDRKLGIKVGNCCFLLHVVRFVSYAPVKHSSCFNNLNKVRFRFVIE